MLKTIKLPKIVSESFNLSTGQSLLTVDSLTPNGPVRKSVTISELLQSINILDILDLMDVDRRVIPVATILGLTPESVVDVDAYVDGASIFQSVSSPLLEKWKNNITQQNMTTNAAGNVTNVAGATSLSLRNINCFGYVLSVRANSNQTGNVAQIINLVDNAGAVQNTWSLLMNDVNGLGRAFFARTTSAGSTNQAGTTAAPGAFGAFAADAEVSYPSVVALNSDTLRMITSDTEAENAGAFVNYYVLQGQNAITNIFPVPVNKFTKEAFFKLYAMDRLDLFGKWAIENFLNAGSVSTIR